MSGIYLKGVEMPTKGYRLILVHADGTVQTTDGETTAIPVPPHGDLIDRDAYAYPGDLIDEPVIIPADPAEEDE